MKKEILYALTESINNDRSWFNLLNTYLEKAEFVEFNVLYDSTKLNSELDTLEPYLVGELERKDKIYSSGTSRRYRLNDRA
ncbi:hypothetical protein [Pontibacter fetidus]|uniref:Uncharacterized protein n=1 Tax=Pontibacter fetidus TaxID=2700082 RepID=A0A6B2H1L6_9BACT|nr:hypothetical protein [Pontibacter fetidus]NDK56018.1 hypothetical protein [Pontibacter fetidus]